ncbi:MAG: hypothetical protein LAO51_11620 [Acidobacteriia bacterium]|nr:hypothetical protein [Terriglobia bacterium]
MRTSLPLALAAVVLAALPVDAQSPAAGIERLRRENTLLQRRLDLANGDRFYLVLDPATSSLKLMLKGAVLQDYAVQALEVGAPRVAYAARTLPDGWRGRIWERGNLVPPRELDRVEIVAPPPSKNADEDNAPPVPIPQTPEEKYPVPHRYHVRFEGGLSIEIRRQGERESASGFWNGLGKSLGIWWADVKAVLSRSSPEADDIRLRVMLRPADADSFYRALPPDTRLLVLPEPET